MADPATKKPGRLARLWPGGGVTVPPMPSAGPARAACPLPVRGLTAAELIGMARAARSTTGAASPGDRSR